MAAKKAVVVPTKVITNSAVELYSNNGEDLSNRYIPAVQILIRYIYLNI